MEKPKFLEFIPSRSVQIFLILPLLSLLLGRAGALQTRELTRQYKFNVEYRSLTRLCKTKQVATVNGRFPGPTIYAHEGDRLIVKVTNRLKDKNITIHWHGVRQLRTGWSDGPAYITQCPIQPGRSYSYDFTITGQRGTLFWHAHISWLRVSVYGALVILPKLGVPYPFKQPAKEVPILLGEWWNADVEEVIKQALHSGGAPNISDAYTINGQPGALYNCSTPDTFVLPVVINQTYLLRVINAGLNNELFFGVANHEMTVVGVDAGYTKSFSTKVVMIAPGQTLDVLITANQPPGRYYIAAAPYMSNNVSFDNTTTTAILEYAGSPNSTQPFLPRLPFFNDTNFADNFSNSLRSLDSTQYPSRVPQHIDRDLFFTIGLARKSCPAGRLCQGGGRLSASVNNVSFVLPTTALLQAYYFSTPRVFSTDFPDNPPKPFNFTGPQPRNINPQTGTRLNRISFNSSVQLILQDTSILGAENHPVHLHGYNFYVVGQGRGNYDANNDPKAFNLVDPQERNTIGVPAGGWAALRFQADNPGVWLMHCHLEIHTSWGLDMAFLVENGNAPNQSLLPPPSDLPSC